MFVLILFWRKVSKTSTITPLTLTSLWCVQRLASGPQSVSDLRFPEFLQQGEHVGVIGLEFGPYKGVEVIGANIGFSGLCKIFLLIV